MSKKIVIGIIPARMGSSRFPGKPLADICGKAMIHHVYFRSEKSSMLDDVYIATCDKEIEDYCLANNMNVIMTKSTHERCSDRCAEAMVKVEKDLGVKIDILVMIQGDEPLVTADMIDSAVNELRADEHAKVVNLMAEIKTVEEYEDPNEVKVVIDKNNYAIYFSREPIPSRKKGCDKFPMYKQVCIIPFTRESLLEFNRMEQTSLEIIESVDMLRFIENGMKVKMVLTGKSVYSVDSIDDLKRVSKILLTEND